jgi:hypothetical protein
MPVEELLQRQKQNEAGHQPAVDGGDVAHLLDRSGDHVEHRPADQ